MTDQTDPLAALRGRGPFTATPGMPYVWQGDEGCCAMAGDLAEPIAHALNLALAADKALAAKDAEIAAESNRADLHANLVRRTAAALGKPTSGEGSDWSDIPEQVAALKVQISEQCETCTLYMRVASLKAHVRKLEAALLMQSIDATDETLKE